MLCFRALGVSRGGNEAAYVISSNEPPTHLSSVQNQGRFVDEEISKVKDDLNMRSRVKDFIVFIFYIS